LSRRLVLYVLADGTLSNRAISAVRSVERVLPSDVQVIIRHVNPESPAGGSKLPALYFKASKQVVYRLTGSFTADDIMSALRRLG